MHWNSNMFYDGKSGKQKGMFRCLLAYLCGLCASHQPSEWQICFKIFLRALTQNATIVCAISIFETRGITERTKSSDQKSYIMWKYLMGAAFADVTKSGFAREKWLSS